MLYIIQQIPTGAAHIGVGHHLVHVHHLTLTPPSSTEGFDMRFTPQIASAMIIQ